MRSLKVALSLSQIKTLNELAELLYFFLPGKAHPLAQQNISFPGVADSISLAKFWIGGSKLPAVSQLLTNTFQYQNSSFCPLVLEIVRRGMTYRQGKNDPVTREEIDMLNKLVAQLGFKIPELYDPKFIDNLPRKQHEAEVAPPTEDVPEKVIQELKNKLLELSSLPPQERGFQFEKFIKDLFEAFNLAPRGSFRLVGEQIDGSFQFQGETYLVEATWQNEPVGNERLSFFSSKVDRKAKWSRGLLISYSGFSSEGLKAFTTGKPINIVCMDGLDLSYVLEGKLNLCSVIEQKVRRAAESNHAYISVRELFPNAC